MTPTDDYVDLRMDIAELKGVVTGSLSALQAGHARLEEESKRVHAEFDMVHSRYNRLESTVAVHEESIKNLRARDGHARANISLWIAGAGVIIALASKITWA